MLIMKDYVRFQVLAKKLLWKYLIFLIKKVVYAESSKYIN